MAKPKPKCGTRQGYQYHIRHGENVCGPCQDAKAESMQEWRDSKRAEAGNSFGDDLDAEPLPKLDDLDPVATALENLRQVRAALRSAPPASVAGLTKREGELTAWLVKERDAKKGEKKSALDEIAERRAARQAAAG